MTILIRSRCLGAACLTVLALAGPPEARAQGRAVFHERNACPEALPPETRCGSVSVPERRTHPDGRRIELNVVVVPARSGAGAEALLIFSGGPGQAATESARFVPNALEPLRDDFDLIFFDQRGTGDSNGLYCEPSDDPVRWFTEGVFDARSYRRCRARLQERADLTAYRTGPSVDDVAAVLDATGHPAVHVRGASYGTRMALAFAAAHPTRVRSLTLAGVVPPDVRTPYAFSGTFRSSLLRLMEDCDADAACRTETPLFDHVAAILERLDHGSVAARISHDGTTIEVPVDRAAFTYAVRGILYGGRALELPHRLREAARTGSLDWFAEQYAARARELAPGLAFGMHLSTVCAEDVAADGPREAVAQPAPMHDLLLSEYREACDVWAVPGADRSVLSPAAPLPVPTLVFSGRRDPVTPPEYGERVRGLFLDMRHVVFPRGGHGYTGVEPSCALRLFIDFVRDPVPGKLDAECADGPVDPWPTISPQEAPRGPETVRQPDEARLVVDDLVHFRETLDALAAEARTAADTLAIIQRSYFDRATPGLALWAENFDFDAADLAARLRESPAFFGSLRDLDRRVLDQEPRIRTAFRRWVDIHPEAAFPATYFFVGGLSAGGLVREEGLLIGADLYSADDSTPLHEFDGPGGIRGIERIPYLVSHELAHFQQALAQGVEAYRALYDGEGSLLGLSIREGSADFLAQLTADGHINPAAHAYGNGHEAELWALFREEMHAPETGDWMFARPADPAWPRDLGYYFGHRITESFYVRSPDTARPIQAILRVTDFADFLHRSGYGPR